MILWPWRRRAALESAIIRAIEQHGAMNGVQICYTVGREAGTLTPTLARMERAGKLASAWGQPANDRLPRQRLYRLP